MTKKLETRVSDWEKTGRTLLNDYLDTLVPYMRVWLDETGFTEWPEQEELWNWAEDIEDYSAMQRFSAVIGAFGPQECVLHAEKLAFLIIDRWPTPADVKVTTKKKAKRT